MAYDRWSSIYEPRGHDREHRAKIAANIKEAREAQEQKETEDKS
jgi:hypothetical protein